MYRLLLTFEDNSIFEKEAVNFYIKLDDMSMEPFLSCSIVGILSVNEMIYLKNTQIKKISVYYTNENEENAEEALIYDAADITRFDSIFTSYNVGLHAFTTDLNLKG